MRRWSEADGDVLEGLGLGLVPEGLGLGLVPEGLGLGLVVVALGVGLGEVLVGVGDGAAEALDDALALGLGVALAEDVLAVGVGVALALLADTAASWAADGFVAAGAGAALLISKVPVSPARRIRNPEIMPNVRIVARRLRMGYALVTVVIPVRIALVAMVRPVNSGNIPRSSHSTPGRLIKGSARAKGI